MGTTTSRLVERPDDVLHADVRAQHHGQYADDDQYDVLPQHVVEAAEVAFGPQDADLDERREPDAQYGQAQCAEQRYEQFQPRYGYGQQDCKKQANAQSFISVIVKCYIKMQGSQMGGGGYFTIGYHELYFG